MAARRQHPLVGREAELDRARDLLVTGGALLVRGPAGIGRTALLEAASSAAREHGVVVLPAAGIAAEAHLRFAALHTLLRPVLAHVDALPDPQRDALLGAFGMASATPDALHLGLATLALLEHAATLAPVALVVDDAQWLDPATAQTLAFVARRLGEGPVAVLAALPDGTTFAGATDAARGAGVPELWLGPLGARDAGRVLDLVAPELGDERRAWVLRSAAGNPLALTELPLAPVVDAPPAGPAFVPLTPTLEAAFTARAAELPAPTRTLLLAAAANDATTLAEALGAASLLTGTPVTVDDLAPAVAAGLVEADGPALRFRHPLIRSALHQHASPAERAGAHRALADVLADQPSRRVWHRVASATGPDEALATELEQAAQSAQQRGAADVALVALDRAVELTAEPFRRGVRLLRVTELAWEAGRPDVVAEAIARASALDLAPAERRRLAALRELYDHGARADADPVPTFTGIAEQLLDAGLPEEATRALLTASLRVRWSTAGPDVRARILAVAERLPLAPDDPNQLAIRAQTDPFTHGAATLAQLDAITIEPGTDPRHLFLLGAAANALGAFEHAAAFLADAAAGLRREGRTGLLAQAQTSYAWAAVGLGMVDAGVAAADEAIALGRGEPRWNAVAQLARAALHGLRGDADAAERLAAAAESVLLPVAALPMEALTAIVRGKTALAGGRHADAFDHLRRLFDPHDVASMPPVRSWALADLADAGVHSGHHAAVAAIVASQEPVAAQSRSPALLAALALARPLVASDDDAEALFQEGLGGDHAAQPLVRARLLLAYGAWLRRRRRVAESRAPLRAARETFGALGIPTWAERARQELRASGETSRRRDLDARDELTPQEVQIAQLAAEGLTNREIGQRLYLSHRTVGSHLYRIFPKLGVTSRAELRRVLPGLEGEPVT